jgi:hypothetical protein
MGAEPAGHGVSGGKRAKMQKNPLMLNGAGITACEEDTPTGFVKFHAS